MEITKNISAIQAERRFSKLSFYDFEESNYHHNPPLSVVYNKRQLVLLDSKYYIHLLPITIQQGLH